MRIKEITIFMRGHGLMTLSGKEWADYCLNSVMEGDTIEIIEIYY